ncbi:Tim44 domain-containing protein [Bermanella sp. WJH001]|uniref:Tim44 domain-containing protein n=1 Tax=Bermanella sp. WJH001 TaxID=3048005 RepID=UPI0024BDFF68|nr:Tim44-like domain-containing protein [Bermanella sp. WJH001]MDJ1539859.1 Tim44-like domain-containing protein [Bermanella sp. WJH001]
MKYVFSVFLAGILAMTVAEPASAKKFGSGGFGKSFQTSPFKKQTPAAPNKAAPNAEKSKSMRPGMGGLMGGLLAGGIFAYLLGSGAFEGLQFMDILLFALIGFVLFKLFARPKQQQQYAGMQRSGFEQSNEQAPVFQAQSNTTTDSIPLQFPQGFDVKAFEKGALDHFALVHKAWDEGEFSTVAEYVDPSLLEQLKQQRAQYAAKLDNKIIDLSADIVRAEPIAQGHRLSILFRGLMKDMQSNEEHGVFDVWHLEKGPSNTWLIVGIEAE